MNDIGEVNFITWQFLTIMKYYFLKKKHWYLVIGLEEDLLITQDIYFFNYANIVKIINVYGFHQIIK